MSVSVPGAVSESCGRLGRSCSYTSLVKMPALVPTIPTAAVDNKSGKSLESGIREVWASNLDAEMHNVRRLVQKYRFIAMDTEFPGVVAKPIGDFRSSSDYQYQLLRCNVDLLRIIQLGMTFYDESGHLAKDCATFQFNFKFSLSEDMYAQDSIDLLRTSGIQFQKHEEDGIDPVEFATLLTTSGVVLFDNIVWLSFHAGYDFGYLLKILTCQPLPRDESEFFEILKIFFPNIYDVKYLMKSCKKLKGGLQEVADQLELERVGPQHQAGSDSLLTGAAFFKMKELYFEDNVDDTKYCGHLYGLGASFMANGGGAGGSAGETGPGDLAFPVTAAGSTNPTVVLTSSASSSALASGVVVPTTSAPSTVVTIRPASVGP